MGFGAAGKLLEEQELARVHNVELGRLFAQTRVKGCKDYDNGKCTGGDYCAEKAEEQICCIACEHYTYHKGLIGSTVRNSCPDPDGICAILQKVDPKYVSQKGSILQIVNPINIIPYLKSTELKEIN